MFTKGSCRNPLLFQDFHNSTTGDIMGFSEHIKEFQRCLEVKKTRWLFLGDIMHLFPFFHLEDKVTLFGERIV